VDSEINYAEDKTILFVVIFLQRNESDRSFFLPLKSLTMDSILFRGSIGDVILQSQSRQILNILNDIIFNAISYFIFL